ncbi:MAG: MFS transporter, partial [Deltaproteobacteria bacterium]|nr:MFS transporter [Deltaproteobacteria bacterium]
MNNEQVKKLLRYRWLIFWVLAIAYLFVYFHRLSLSVVANDIVKDFNTSAGVMGLLGSIYFYCYAAMQLPAGLLSDSIGPRKTVTVFLLVASAGSILFGLAPDIYTAFGGRVLVGFGVSMVFIPTMKILSQWFRAKEFASMAG